MFIISVFVKGRESAIPLYFKERADAESMQKKIGIPITHTYDITDDYGHNLHMAHDQIAGALLQNWEQFLQAQTDYSILQQEAKMKFDAKMGVSSNIVLPGRLV